MVRIPKIGESFKVVVGKNKIETRTATADMFLNSPVIYARIDDKPYWWPIPIKEGRNLTMTDIRYYLTGSVTKYKYHMEKYDFPFFLTVHIL